MKLKALATTAVLLLAAALLNGCITSAGASHGATLEWNEPFHSLRGQRVTLQRPLTIQPQQDGPPQPASSEDSARFLDLRMPREPKLDLPTVLPAGTIIEFDTFHHERIYGITVFPFFLDLFPSPPTYTAWFTVPQRHLPKYVYLEYRWGYGPYLWPAPWEPSGTQPKYVGTNGNRYKSKLQ